MKYPNWPSKTRWFLWGFSVFVAYGLSLVSSEILFGGSEPMLIMIPTAWIGTFTWFLILEKRFYHWHEFKRNNQLWGWTAFFGGLGLIHLITKLLIEAGFHRYFAILPAIPIGFFMLYFCHEFLMKREK